MAETADPAEDLALVERARAGDFEAFDRLVERHERRVYGLALGIVRRADDAEDVVQTAFLAALEHLDGFRGDASFATWIARIASNTALKLLRKRRGPPGAPFVPGGAGAGGGGDGDGGGDDDPPHPEFIAGWRDDPIRTVERRELRRLLDEAIDALPEKLRLTFILRDVAGLDTEETAEALAITPANVKVRLLRARLLLRERLTRAFGDEATRVEKPPHGHAAAAKGASA